MTLDLGLSNYVNPVRARAHAGQSHSLDQLVVSTPPFFGATIDAGASCDRRRERVVTTTNRLARHLGLSLTLRRQDRRESTYAAGAQHAKQPERRRNPRSVSGRRHV
jgi:hypothetical protein